MPESFILDITRSKDGVTRWEISDERLAINHYPFTTSFLFSLPDPHLYYSMTEALEQEFPVQECRFRSIYREYEGYQIQADREVAELIEKQTRFQVKLFNVDIRPEQRFAAEKRIVPGGWTDRDRFMPEHEPPISIMEINCRGNPYRSEELGPITICDKTGNEEIFHLTGPEQDNVTDLYDIVQSSDPDLILFPDYDQWSALLCRKAVMSGILNTLSRTGKFRSLSSRSYFSYGRMEHRIGAKIPEGRIIVDTRQSFIYRKGGIRGIFLSSRLSGLSPNLTSRLTPGTLISSYEVYEALDRGIAVPFRKSDAEANRFRDDMRLDYRGGLILQPKPGIYEEVTQIDFSSFYPSIIVKYNLSPETLGNPDKEGFLASVLDPILCLKRETKRKKMTDPAYAGIDAILKWMLVTCFGYTGYKNARFGRIEVHEQITLKATYLLRECISLIERMDGRVLHAIVDCLFVQGCDQEKAKEAIEKFTSIPTEIERYDWVVFLPQKDGSGSYGSYFGRLRDGRIKSRGIAVRRRNSPPYIKHMQSEMLSVMATELSITGVLSREREIREIYHRYGENMSTAPLSDFVITRRIGREYYTNECIPQAVIDCYRSYGIELVPGMDASFLVRDEKGLLVDPAFDPKRIDTGYYHRLIDTAWKEINYVFSLPR